MSERVGLALMRDETGAKDDLAARMAVVRHAADQGPDSPAGKSSAPRAWGRLTQGERDDLLRMSRAVAGVDQGRKDPQTRFAEQVRRALHEDR